MDNLENLITFSRDWDKAIESNVVDKISQYLADDWIIVGTEGGITTKSVFLNSIESGDLSHSKMESDEIKGKVYEGCGVIVSKGTSEGIYKGQRFSFYEWSMSTFVIERGKWLCVSTMLTPAL